MADNLKHNIFFYSSYIFAIWFMLTSWIWPYYINFIYSLPFGVLSLLLWYFGKKSDTNQSRYKKIPVILIIGAISSVAVLILFLIIN